jgi:hypothetical protein
MTAEELKLNIVNRHWQILLDGGTPERIKRLMRNVRRLAKLEGITVAACLEDLRAYSEALT